MDRIFAELERSTVLMTVGSSGVVEPAGQLRSSGAPQSCAHDLRRPGRTGEQWLL
jgi:hypothetical protein